MGNKRPINNSGFRNNAGWAGLSCKLGHARCLKEQRGNNTSRNFKLFNVKRIMGNMWGRCRWMSLLKKLTVTEPLIWNFNNNFTRKVWSKQQNWDHKTAPRKCPIMTSLWNSVVRSSGAKQKNHQHKYELGDRLITLWCTLGGTYVMTKNITLVLDIY